MNTATLRLLGTFLEIVGGFFLAAEAIKLHNLRALRERYLRATLIRTHPIAVSLNAKAEGAEFPDTYFGILILLGASLVYAALAFRRIGVMDILRSFCSLVPGPVWIDMVVAIPIAVILLFVLSLVGSFFVQVLSTPLMLAVVLLEFVEKHSASGLIGVLGFLFFVVGAVLKAVLDWMGR